MFSPDDLDLRIDQVANRFEEALRAGASSRAEDLLQEVEEEYRPRLLRELQEVARQLQLETGNEKAVQAQDLNATTQWVVEQPGMSVGPYKLLEQIGEGGFGVVFMAQQQQPVRRKVALKVIKPGMDSRQVIARFEAERQALALMEHPNIARVLDAGESSSGRPYFVMELVKGIPITTYCDEARLTPHERLALFIDVCRAVQHAHQKGVIHRDLKPSNVLVTMHGDSAVVKVIDFGVAKATGEPLTDKTLFTAFAQFIGTPLYMSPEQAALSGLDVDTRSDVYSLGVMLYELLTGTTPLQSAQLKEAAFDEIRRLIREEEAPRPSTRISSLGDKATAISNSRKTEPSKLRQLLRNELDWIVLKALEKDRARRYESPSSLARDIERYLRQEEVEACPPSVSYRLRKFARKHWASVMAAASILATIAFLVVMALWFGLERGKLAAHAQREVAITSWDHGRSKCDDGEIAQGLLMMAHALKTLPVGSEHGHLRNVLRMEITAWHRHCHVLRQSWQHSSEVRTVAVSPSGKFAITGCQDGQIHIWSTDSGQCLFAKHAHDGGVLAVACGPTDETFLSGGADRRVLLWDGRPGRMAGELVGELSGHDGDVLAVAISPDGKRALTGSADRTARLWTIAERRCDLILPHTGPVTTVGFHPSNGSFFAGGSEQKDPGDPSSEMGCLRIYGQDRQDLARFETLETEENGLFDKRVNTAAISPDGETLIVGDADWTGSFWDWESRRQIAWEERSQGNVRAVAISPDGHTVITGAEESGMAHLWDADILRSRWKDLDTGGIAIDLSDRSGALPPPLAHSAPITAVAFIPPAGDRFLTACQDGYVRVWQRAPGYEVKRFPHHPRDRQDKSSESRRDFVVRGIAIHPQAQFVATAGWDGKVRLWNVDDGRIEEPAFEHPCKVTAVRFTPDGKHLLTAGGDGRVRFWNPVTGGKIREIVHHENHEAYVAISRDGRQLLTGGAGTAQLWDAMSLKKIGEPLRHCADQRMTVGTAISPDALTFLTVGQEGSALLWKRDHPSPIALQQSHLTMWQGDFNADGSRAITASDDHTVRVWNTCTGDEELQFAHHDSVFSATFSPDSTRIVTGSREGAQLWDAALRRRIGPSCYLDDDVMQVVCSSDGSWVAFADWNGYGALWRLPKAVEDTPEELLSRLEREVGLKPATDRTSHSSFTTRSPASPQVDAAR